MRCRAHKFGGSSLADADRIRHVAGLMLEADESRQVVVVSAMQGVTDALIGVADAAAGGGDWQAALEALRQRHLDAANALLDAPADTHGWLDAQFAQLAELLRAVGLLRQPGRAAFERIQGMGEVLSSRLLHAHLRERGGDYALLDARDVLVVQPGELGVIVDWEESARRLAAWRQIASAIARGRHRLRRRRQGRPADGAGPQRQRFLGGDLRGPVRCRGTAHLVRCRWRAVRRSATGAGSGVADRDELPGSLRAGLFRRESDPSADDDPGDRARPADPDAQHLQPRVRRHAHRCRGWRRRPGQGADAQHRSRPGQPGRRRPDRRARHRRAPVRRPACGTDLGGDDLAGLLRALDLLGGARSRCAGRARGAAGRVRPRTRLRAGAGRAGGTRHQRAGRGRRRHGRHPRRRRATVRRTGAGAGQHPRDRAGFERTQHLGCHRSQPTRRAHCVPRTPRSGCRRRPWRWR